MLQQANVLLRSFYRRLMLANSKLRKLNNWGMSRRYSRLVDAFVNKSTCMDKADLGEVHVE
jgi:hypothetical protein